MAVSIKWTSCCCGQSCLQFQSSYFLSSCNAWYACNIYHVCWSQFDICIVIPNAERLFVYSLKNKNDKSLISSILSFLGAVIIFTGLLSTAFLGRLLKGREWLGMLTVIMGLSVVGASDFIFGSGGSNNSLNSIITGDLLIVMAQIVTASQMVWEEKFVTKHNVPALQAVSACLFL